MSESPYITDLDDYQKFARRIAIYPNRGNIEGLVYTTLGLTGEAGEVSNQVKKILRDDNRICTASRRSKIVDELGDVLWYVAMCADELGIDLSEVAGINILKLSERRDTNTLHGR